jgi:hypothetical protein
MFSKTHFFVVLAMCCLVALSTRAQSLPVQEKYQVTRGNYPFGDLNHDGEVNVADINLLIGVVLGEYVPEDYDAPNMTIAEFKAKHWQDARNYVDTITDEEIIHGWVVSSDESGNIYKNLYIMDESGTGIPISINQNFLYRDYPIGQEIILNLKGYWVGKYNGDQRLGYPYWYEAGQTWEVTFLPQNYWEAMVMLNGAPNPSKVQPVSINLSDIVAEEDPATVMRYQGALVSIKDVMFAEADGYTTFAEPRIATNRTIIDADGYTLTLRTSNYADFRDNVLPRGKVDVVGVLQHYSNTWQLFLRDRNDVTGGDVSSDPVTSLNESFDNSLPYSWTNIIASGDKSWYHTIYAGNGYAAATGYKGNQPPFDTWLITPGLDIKNAASKTLSFRTEVNGYDSSTTRLEVYILNSLYPDAATVMVKLDPVLPTAPAIGYSDWCESGEIDLSQWADGIYYIGFRYSATQDVNYATWCLDDVKFGL